MDIFQNFDKQEFNTQVRTYIHICILTGVHIDTNINAYTRTRSQTYTHIHTSMLAHTHIYLFIHVHCARFDTVIHIRRLLILSTNMRELWLGWVLMHGVP